MDIETAREILASHAWKHPRYYGGFSPDGDYLICSQHRDSDAVERSNYRSISRILQCDSYDDGRENPGARPLVYDFRAGHCLAGWVEYLLVRQDAPDSVLIEAADILAGLEDYPIVDDNDLSELEINEAEDYWRNMRTSDRIEACKDVGISIFAARRDEMPFEYFDRLRD